MSAFAVSPLSASCRWLLAIVALGLPGESFAFDLREPKIVAVQLSGASGSTASARASVTTDFLQVRPLADFSCPSGHIVRELRLKTPHDWLTVDVSSTRAKTLANQSIPSTPLVATAALRQACSEGRTSVDVRISLSTICVNRSKSTFAEAIRTDRASETIRIDLTCDDVATPRHIPATAVPSTFLHDCPGTSSGIEGLHEASRLGTSSRPLQCGSTYDPEDPKFTRMRVYRSKHSCEPGWVLSGYARSSLEFDLSGEPDSSFGQVRWCHQRVDPGPYFTEAGTVQVGSMRVNMLAAEPYITSQREAKVSFVPHAAPAPPGLPVCKRVDFLLSDEGHRVSILGGGSTQCSSARRTLPVHLGTDGARHAAQMACVNEARRLQRTNAWDSLPTTTGGRYFSVSASVPFGLAARYCYGDETPSGDNWTYEVYCDQLEYQSEWNVVAFAEITVDCRMK